MLLKELVMKYCREPKTQVGLATFINVPLLLSRPLPMTSDAGHDHTHVCTVATACTIA